MVAPWTKSSTLSNAVMLEARLIVRLHDPVVRVDWLVHGKATANERNEKKKRRKVTARGSSRYICQRMEKERRTEERGWKRGGIRRRRTKKKH